MKFKKGDLVAQYLGDSIYLIAVTSVRNDNIRGYIIDDINNCIRVYDRQLDEHYTKEPFFTTEKREYYPAKFEDCILIEEGYFENE